MPDPTPLALKYASGALEIKAVEDGGMIEGVASAFHVVDSDGDVIHPGAFKGSLERRGGKSPLLWQHDSAHPVGVGSYEETETGLMIRGQLLVDEVAKAREARALAKAGALGGFSVGFMIVRAEPRGNGGGLDIFEADLWETSLVTFPANPQARITSVKAALQDGALPTVRDFERLLTRDAGFTRSQALTIIREGFDALTKRDAGDDADHAVIEALERAVLSYKGASQ
jgi:HK97 family phage prohead protease